MIFSPKMLEIGLNKVFATFYVNLEKFYSQKYFKGLKSRSIRFEIGNLFVETFLFIDSNIRNKTLWVHL